ncbi:protein kinase domain-containing protein [Spirochaeta isovalerica]|uniref:non-specific serine/threonine protein kinase n=1 Tax=Spirochaeta isovalerica TaxID=150 RepID=A0A841R8H8_9SPIO|nr:serine/threonine-protein kinase [Spirochaeta isovalerica]
MSKIPDKVGKYKILSQIGKGGMGVVYSAEHPTLKRKIILKKLTIRDKEFRERFRLEADMMMDLRSDYIVDMYDHFREGSSWYIAMEYIEGMSLDELIKREGPPDLSVLFYIMLCTAKALEYIHARGIVHRDIKPSNIYISRKGDVKLGDFGIASSSLKDVSITDSGTAMGTPAYMAPEQFDDSSTVGIKADLFSFGVTFYEALNGAKPFRSERYTELKKEIRRGKYVPFKNYRKDVSGDVIRLMRRCLRIRPFFRPRNAGEVRKILERQFRKKTNTLVRDELAFLVTSGKPEMKKTKQLTEMVLQTGRKFMPAYVIPLFFIMTLSLLALTAGYYLGGRFGLLRISLIPAEQDSSYTLYPHNSERELDGFFSSKGKKSLFLKEGSYRVRVESGSTVLWRSVYVTPFVKNRNPMELAILAAPPEGLPLDIELSVRDRFSGADLSGETDIFIGQEESWVLFNSSRREGLRTGESFHLKFAREGYLEEKYFLTPRYDQILIDLNVLMTPLPATLSIDIPVGDLRINGKKEYFSPRSMSFEKIPGERETNLQLDLLPGKYFITLEGPEGSIEKEVSLKSGGNYNFP